MKKKLVIILSVGLAGAVHGGQFSPQEQALFDKRLIVEVFRPGSSSGHEIETIHGAKGSGPVLVFIFGREDAEQARAAGREMAAKGLGPDAAVQHLLVEAREKYHGDEFFRKCWMNEAANAYNAVTK